MELCLGQRPSLACYVKLTGPRKAGPLPFMLPILSSYRDAFAFAMMIGILLLRPQELFGSRESVEDRV